MLPGNDSNGDLLPHCLKRLHPVGSHFVQPFAVHVQTGAGLTWDGLRQG